jgi:hypothetical protein
MRSGPLRACAYISFARILMRQKILARHPLRMTLRRRGKRSIPPQRRQSLRHAIVVRQRKNLACPIRRIALRIDSRPRAKDDARNNQ